VSGGGGAPAARAAIPPESAATIARVIRRIAAISALAAGFLFLPQAAAPALAQIQLQLGSQAAPKPAIDIAPHRAVYQMSLASAKSGSGLVSASGALAFEWGDGCDGWTVEQRYKLTLVFSQAAEVEIVTNFATWESKDGLKYRFKVRKTKNGKAEADVAGEAHLAGAGQAGKAAFTSPEKTVMDLPAGTIFPTEHTLVLLRQALADKTLVKRVVFDGATPDGAAEVNALIGRKLAAGQAGAEPLLARPGWYMRMAYFNIDKAAAQGLGEPDYEIGMELQDNGIARAIKLDYADFSIKGTLEKVELLPKPPC